MLKWYSFVQTSIEEAKLTKASPLCGINSKIDPYYGSNQGFENVYQMLDEACDVISKKL